jgi:hypothetical protein
MLPADSLRSFSTTVTVVPGKRTEVMIDVPVGTLTLTASVSPRAGDQVAGAILFLFAGTVAFDTYQQVMDRVVEGQGLARWLGAGSPSPAFRTLVPGDYTVCAIPLAGSPEDQAFMQRVRAHDGAVRACCTPVRVAAAPEDQTITIELPAMRPLPTD